MVLYPQSLCVSVMEGMCGGIEYGRRRREVGFSDTEGCHVDAIGLEFFDDAEDFNGLETLSVLTMGLSSGVHGEDGSSCHWYRLVYVNRNFRVEKWGCELGMHHMPLIGSLPRQVLLFS